MIYIYKKIYLKKAKIPNKGPKKKKKKKSNFTAVRISFYIYDYNIFEKLN
jgi:hypothetical protein